MILKPPVENPWLVFIRLDQCGKGHPRASEGMSLWGRGVQVGEPDLTQGYGSSGGRAGASAQVSLGILGNPAPWAYAGAQVWGMTSLWLEIFSAWVPIWQMSPVAPCMASAKEDRILPCHLFKGSPKPPLGVDYTLGTSRRQR